MSSQVELDRFRVALKATLWCWALYWPGGGLLLLYGGLNPAGLAIIGGGLLCFVLLTFTGALDSTSSRTLRQFLVERPLYLVAALIALLAIVPITNMAEDAGLLLFGAAFFGTTTYALVRLQGVARQRGGSVFASRTDQAFLALLIGAIFSSLIFLDALLGFFGARVPMTSNAVAAANWVNLLYPGLVLLGTRGLREPLRSPLRRARAAAAEAGATTRAKPGKAQLVAADE